MLKVIAVAVAIAATTTVAGAQGTTYNKSTAKPATQASTTAKPHKRMKKAESQAALLKEAKIAEADARATALKEVPNGSVKSEEIEREHGKLIYSYDITVPGKSGIQEVNLARETVERNRERIAAYMLKAAKEAKEKKTTAKK